MNIDKLITEAINEYLNEDIFSEAGKKSKGKKHKHKKPKDKKRKGKKLKNGRRGAYDVKYERETNPNLTNQDNADLADMIDSDLINTAAVAKKVYPDHTPQGAQSQLRKKVKGLTNDTGSKYRLKKKEANRILRALSDELN